MNSITRFDRVVAGVVVVILAAIGLTIALGDRVGVTVLRVAPLGEGHSSSPIAITFAEPMDHASVEQRLSTDPPIQGRFSWNGPTVSFQPNAALLPGSSYTVTLDSGARADSGRELLTSHRFSFSVAPLRVAYLYPADGAVQNIWVVDPRTPESAQQITHSPTGIFDFSVSPDGTQVAFSEANALQGTFDIKLLDLETGGLRQLTNCADASCTNPVWNPNGQVIAYERVDYNSDFKGLDQAAAPIGQSPARVWLIDLQSSPATTRPLFSELQRLGYSPQWSADGKRIALYDRSTIATLVYDQTDGQTYGVPNTSGVPGALSPDGSRLAYTETVLIDGGGSRSTLQVVDLASGSQKQLTSADQEISDSRAQWSPDGKVLAVARQDPTVVRGIQIYFVDPQTGDATLFTKEPRYANALFWYDPTGTQLLVQRFPELGEDMQPDPQARPEIWTFDISSGRGEKIATNGYIPHWIP